MCDLCEGAVYCCACCCECFSDCVVGCYRACPDCSCCVECCSRTGCARFPRRCLSNTLVSMIVASLVLFILSLTMTVLSIVDPYIFGDIYIGDTLSLIVWGTAAGFFLIFMAVSAFTYSYIVTENDCAESNRCCALCLVSICCLSIAKDEI